VEQINLPLSHDQAIAKQKACNICHSGCLDCHYTPTKEQGVHSFSRVPPSSNCSGGGRSTFVCHAGTMERRRGDSYLGKDFSEPAGLPEDVHAAKKIECVDCHQSVGGMGHIERKATCQDCHIEVEQAIAVSVHKNVSCEACHVQVLGGYEMTSWGPGKIASQPNPFKKYSLYYGPQGPPIVLKDQNGRWMPVKIWPNSVGGIKETIAPQPGLTFRWPKGETQDAYALLGTFRVPAGNNNYLAWLQVEQVAHPLGKARACESCHAAAVQTSQVKWQYFDTQGAEPFSGRQTIVADRNGIRIQDIRATSKITNMPEGNTTYFAAWMHLGDIWRTSGDFSIPKSDPAKYRDLDKGIRDALARLRSLERRINAKEANGEDVKKLRRRWRDAKAAAMHEPKTADILFDEGKESGLRVLTK
jgi:hypothetical protein